MKKVLFIGQEPDTVDFSDPALPPGLDAEKIQAGIAAGMQQITDRSGMPSSACFARTRLPEARSSRNLRRRITIAW